jgi:hypothetical protein
MRAEALLGENNECETQIILEMGVAEGTGVLTDASLSHFAKIRAPLLSAFIRCRELEDLGSAKKMSMPKKGNLNGALQGEICARTGKQVMILWAFEIREKLPHSFETSDPSTDPDAVDQELYAQAVNNQDEEAQIVDFEDEVHNTEAQRKEGMEDVVDQQVGGDEDDDGTASWSSGSSSSCYTNFGDDESAAKIMSPLPA